LDAYQLVEIAVKPTAQGQGIGGRLHDSLLSGLPYQTALLSTLHAETIAYQMYLSRGWKPLIGNFHFPGVSRTYIIMGRKL
jgi:hypothetical protein